MCVCVCWTVADFGLSIIDEAIEKCNAVLLNNEPRQVTKITDDLTSFKDPTPVRRKHIRMYYQQLRKSPGQLFCTAA